MTNYVSKLSDGTNTYVVKDANAPKLTADNTFTGINTYSTYNGLKTKDPIILKESDNTAEGGQIEFESGDTEVNTGKTQALDRYNGTFRFWGGDSNDNVKVPFIVSIQEDKIALSSNAQKNLTEQMVPNYGAGVSVTNYYACPSNGFIVANGVAGGYGETVYLYINNVNIAVAQHTSSWIERINACYPVKTGDVISFAYLGGGSITFYPANGG